MHPPARSSGRNRTITLHSFRTWPAASSNGKRLVCGSSLESVTFVSRFVTRAPWRDVGKLAGFHPFPKTPNPFAMDAGGCENLLSDVRVARGWRGFRSPVGVWLSFSGAWRRATVRHRKVAPFAQPNPARLLGKKRVWRPAARSKTHRNLLNVGRAPVSSLLVARRPAGPITAVRPPMVFDSSSEKARGWARAFAWSGKEDTT
jgi:hypothetical protein